MGRKDDDGQYDRRPGETEEEHGNRIPDEVAERMVQEIRDAVEREQSR